MLSFRIINYYTIFRMKHHRCERICIVLLILGHQPAFFCCCQAFLLSSTSTRQKFDSEKSTSRERTTTSLLSLYGKGDNNKIDDGNNHDDNDDDDGMISSKSNRLPALGPVGTSSHTTVTTSLDDYSGSNKTASFVASKFCLQYTCNVCEHRNRLIVSRLAYREGMVIAICKGCKSKHWIADNLDPTLANKNIEDYFNSRGESDKVTRVKEEVYEIERIYGISSGKITDEHGDVMLE